MNKTLPAIRVVVPYPNSGEIHPRCTASLNALKRCDKVRAEIVTARGSSISYNRNIGIIGLERQPHVKQSGFAFDYALTVDADIAFTPGDVLSLLARDVDIVSGAYLARKSILKKDSPKYVAGYISDVPQGRPVIHLPADAFKGCAPVDWVGGGFTLIRQNVLEAVEFPYYVESEIPYINDDGSACAEWVGEDIGFSIKARRAGFAIHVDLDVVVEHIAEPYNERNAAMADLKSRLDNLNKLIAKIDADIEADSAELDRLIDRRIAARANIVLLETLIQEDGGDIKAPLPEPSEEALNFIP